MRLLKAFRTTEDNLTSNAFCIIMLLISVKKQVLIPYMFLLIKITRVS